MDDPRQTATVNPESMRSRSGSSRFTHPEHPLSCNKVKVKQGGRDERERGLEGRERTFRRCPSQPPRSPTLRANNILRRRSEVVRTRKLERCWNPLERREREKGKRGQRRARLPLVGDESREEEEGLQRFRLAASERCLTRLQRWRRGRKKNFRREG